MVEAGLNLARKWRSKNFDQIVGQAMPVRMLKNSLYLNQFFPVYLFSGQHGCGKTSTARIFAAAINCFHLPDFQRKPREYNIPCGVCDSCQAMSAGRHPDFFEIDAASHTGVDNIRQILEAATLLPLMGRKKIYLIDEAHMLSKAAFNALLKILEEPPASVLFILATTDAQKVIETVRSRCFKVFFTAVKHTVLVEHLVSLCQQEKINYQQAGLELIAEESAGSVRDAINILEQVRFSSSVVTQEAVMRVLGRIDDATLIYMVEVLLSGNMQHFAQVIHEIKFEQYAADIIWYRLTALIRALVWYKYGAKVDQFAQHAQALTKLAHLCSIPFLHRIMQALHSNEQLFIRTTAKHELLEVILLQLCYKKSGNDGGGPGANALNAAIVRTTQAVTDQEVEEEQDDDSDDEDDEAISMRTGAAWLQFIRGIDQLDEQLLSSIIKQAQFQAFDQATKQVNINFVQGGSFFKDVLNDTKQKWHPLLIDIFGPHAELAMSFDVQSTKTDISSSPIQTPVRQEKTISPSAHETRSNGQKTTTVKRHGVSAGAIRAHGPTLDVSDKQNWQKTHLILRYFPGQVYELRESV